MLSSVVVGALVRRIPRGCRGVQLVGVPERDRPNVEALRLYRDILRECRHYDWPDDKGRLWRDVLKSAAREEFEQARFEQDPEIIARLLVVGRDALMQTQERFAAQRHKLNTQDQQLGASFPAHSRP